MRGAGSLAAAGAAGGGVPRCWARSPSVANMVISPAIATVGTIHGRVIELMLPPRRVGSARTRAFLWTEHAVGFAIGRGELLQHADVLGSVACRGAADGDDGAGAQFARLVSTPDHAARRAGFERPSRQLAVRFLDVEEEPGVRVGESHLHDRALNRDRLCGVVG